MNPDLSSPIQWTTVTFCDAAGTLSGELDGLHQHMQQCSAVHSRARVLGHHLDTLHRSLSGRFVTSLSLLVALLGATLLVW
jgi:hypothetical protein